MERVRRSGRGNRRPCGWSSCNANAENGTKFRPRRVRNEERGPREHMSRHEVLVLCKAARQTTALLDRQKNAPFAITTTLRSCGGLPAEPKPKRPASDYANSPTNSPTWR